MDICFSNLNLRDDAGMFWVDTAVPLRPQSNRQV